MIPVPALSATPRLLRALWRSRGASVLPIMAAALVPTMAMIGAGIDYGRAYLVASKLQGAADAGALAAVRAKQVSSNSANEAQALGAEYVRANFPINYSGATLATPAIAVIEDDDVITATVTLRAAVDTALLRVIGIDVLNVSVSSVAEASETLPTSIEALLVLDNTGSMAGARMTALKNASKNFIDTIYGSKNTRDGFAVGILPYNTMVNVGRLVRARRPEMVTEYPGYTDIAVTDPTGWKGCVFADETIQNISNNRFTLDSGAYDLTDNMPGEWFMPKFEPFVYPPVYVDSFQDINNRYLIPAARRDNFYSIPTVRGALVRMHGQNICKDPGSGAAVSCTASNSVIDFNRLPDRTLYANARYYSHKSGGGTSAWPNNLWGPSPNYQCPSEALPVSYSATRTQLRSYIDNENAALMPGTGTFHNPAMTWAYRLMQRDDIFTRDRPENIPVKKIVIFMTDGNFDSRDDGRWVGGARIYDTAYTAYKTYEDRLIVNSTTRAATVDHLARRFAKTCEAMKADGIEIYTIAFALNNNTEGNATREMFRTCATDRNTHFFSAATGADLNNAFVTIAAELIRLRLAQ
jgi:Flp pilus assembly protein TadG